VDYVSGVGYPGGLTGRHELGLTSGGPCMVVTPKCIFDFDREAGRMKVASIHEGVSDDELREATGFDLGDLGHVPRTQKPSDEELTILRMQVDPRNILALRD
jgi:glutaconate CoA-transferase, subunit B